MLRQILKVIKLLGLKRAARMKRHHAEGLVYVRGYAATCCWWALLRCGLLDELAKGAVAVKEFVGRKGLDLKTLESMVEYLDGIGLLVRRGGQVEITKQGRVLIAEPRGMFELLWAYEPCFTNLGGMLDGSKKYGRDFTRDVTWVGIGSASLCEQLPYPVMRRMVRDHEAKMVLDLGCGDMGLIAGLCREDGEVRAHGIDVSEAMIEFCRGKLKNEDYGGRLTVECCDMFEIEGALDTPMPVDCITACDTFHEYLQEPDRIVEVLRKLREVFPEAILVIGEFCLQDADWLRKHPTASLEHHLFHQLSNQEITSAGCWREIFGQAGLTIVEEQVYDLIGHGYFALR
ncbi:MAG: methyltransferase domain-containing protein [Sedimentisphaerales bacterium]|nr:methyltransferase domain-containing protein [Sedimentisphaerales bacterium]